MKKILFLVIISLLAISCGKDNKNKNDNNLNNDKNTDKKLEVTITIQVKKIDSLNIENFVKIYLSRMEHEIKWALDLQKYAKEQNIQESDLETEKGKELISRKQKMEDDFFRQWGISRDTFEKFAQDNEAKIQKYLESNKEIQDFIDKIQELNMKLYSIDDEKDIQHENESSSGK